jgi:hypothetical protein
MIGKLNHKIFEHEDQTEAERDQMIQERNKN